MSRRRCRVQPRAALESSVGAERGGQVGAEHVVPAVVIAGRSAPPPRGRLLARVSRRPLWRVAREEAVVGAEVVIDPEDAGGVGVEARVVRREKKLLQRRVGRRVRLRPCSPADSAPPGPCRFGRNPVAGERLRHAVDGVQRVVDGRRPTARSRRRARASVGARSPDDTGNARLQALVGSRRRTSCRGRRTSAAGPARRA